MATNSNVLQLMSRVLGATFASASWTNWRTVLKAAHALPVTSEERATLERLTGRETLPDQPCRELWLLLGRRSGKSIIAALLAVFATCCQTYTLAPGEVGVFMVIAADRKQARVIKRYISGLLRSHPSLEVLIAKETAEAIWLTNGLCIEIHTCSFRSLRGYTCIGAASTKSPFGTRRQRQPRPRGAHRPTRRDGERARRDADRAHVRLCAAGRGLAHVREHFGRPSADVLVVNAPTTTMNPTIDEQVIAAPTRTTPSRRRPNTAPSSGVTSRSFWGRTA